MGTEDFDHVKPAVRGDGGDIKLLSQAWGDPAMATGPNEVGGIQPAGLFSTAPYVPPVPRVVRHCVGKNNTCENTIRLDGNQHCAGCRLAYVRAQGRQPSTFRD